MAPSWSRRCTPWSIPTSSVISDRCRIWRACPGRAGRCAHGTVSRARRGARVRIVGEAGADGDAITVVRVAEAYPWIVTAAVDPAIDPAGELRGGCAAVLVVVPDGRSSGAPAGPDRRGQPPRGGHRQRDGRCAAGCAPRRG